MPKIKKNNASDIVVLDMEYKENTKDYAVRCLEYNIINMNLKPGAFISEKMVSDVLSISRTPIREAFSILEKTNLIEIYPQKCTMVSLIDIEVIEETSHMRKILEKDLINIICKNKDLVHIKLLHENVEKLEGKLDTNNFYELLDIDREFHEILFSMANRKLTYNIIKDSIKHFDRFRIFNIIEMDRRRVLNEHIEILKYIENEEYEKLENLMEIHLTNVIDDMSFLKTKYPKYFKN